MTDEKDLRGFRIYEIDENTNVPKKIKEGKMVDCDYSEMMDIIAEGLDLTNKTYAIRIGKKGLK